MKTPKLLLVISGIASQFLLQSCGSSYFVKSEMVYNSNLGKEKGHYIIPPPASFSIEQKNVYPRLKNAMADAGIKVVNKPSDAQFVVAYLSYRLNQTISGTKYKPTQSTTSGLAYLSGSSVSSPQTLNYSHTTQSGTYVPYTTDFTTITYAVMIHNKQGEIWRGSASCDDSLGIDPDVMIRSIIARYGTSGEEWLLAK